MTDDRAAPIFFFAPFVSSTMQVEPAWIDYNGHMNMAYFHVLFDRAVEEAFGLSASGRTIGRSAKLIFAAEIHTLYKRELTANDPVRVTLQLIDYDEKRLHFYHGVRHAGEGWVAATCEQLALHVDMADPEGLSLPGRYSGQPRRHEGRACAACAAQGPLGA